MGFGIFEQKQIFLEGHTEQQCVNGILIDVNFTGRKFLNCICYSCRASVQGRVCRAFCGKGSRSRSISDTPTPGRSAALALPLGSEYLVCFELHPKKHLGPSRDFQFINYFQLIDGPKVSGFQSRLFVSEFCWQRRCQGDVGWQREPSCAQVWTDRPALQSRLKCF